MNGAKLNYINKLNGKCPQGTHLSYYRIGGTLCKKCEADAYNESSDPIKAFKQKCGGKVKKLLNRNVEVRLKRKNQVVKQMIRKISLNLSQLKNLRIKLFLRNLRILDQDQKI